jgi:hypothetical protein
MKLPSQVVTVQQALSMGKEDAAWRNEVALMKAMEEFHFTLPQKEMPNWRATRRIMGGIPSVFGQRRFVIVATDGMLAEFWCEEDQQTYEGHVEWFEWSSPETMMVSYYDPVERKQKVFTVVRDKGSPGPMYSYHAPKATNKEVSEQKKKETKVRKETKVEALAAKWI